ncbi:ubiquitin carboxyl-terminal hydrolase [Ceratobasidium sp. AG-Ba]|nr:ubiquitin carboxyl-terminal hydrolase [Ceratobasidium sp. AG-Ba]
MRRGRQEDAHEFLRYTVDALQRSTLCIFSSTSQAHKNPTKVPPSLAETSWVHAIFGGRLRSRVRCRTCGHCSDTFDSILDLSVDLARADTLVRALAQFAKPDILSGEDAYRCEKCKKPVTAEKFMRIHEAPVCLTVHLKRFRPDGRKNAMPIGYPEVLDIQPYMSEGQTSKKYLLYGVIHHLGSGPNSGHYTAHVRGGDGRWTMMDDDLVTFCSNPPVNHKNAYILFYMQTDKAHPSPSSTIDKYFGGVKRTRDEMEVDKPKTKNMAWNPFPDSNKRSRIEDTTKEGVAGPSRVASVAPSSSRTGKALVGYTGSDEIEDAGEVVAPPAETSTSPTTPVKSSTAMTPSKKSATPAKASANPFTMAPIPSSGIPTSSFYGPNKKKEKDKRAGANPFGGLGSSNLHDKKDKEDLVAQMGFSSFGGVKKRMKGKVG